MDLADDEVAGSGEAAPPSGGFGTDPSRARVGTASTPDALWGVDTPLAATVPLGAVPLGAATSLNAGAPLDGAVLLGVDTPLDAAAPLCAAVLLGVAVPLCAGVPPRGGVVVGGGSAWPAG